MLRFLLVVLKRDFNGVFDLFRVGVDTTSTRLGWAFFLSVLAFSFGFVSFICEAELDELCIRLDDDWRLTKNLLRFLLASFALGSSTGMSSSISVHSIILIGKFDRNEFFKSRNLL